MEQINRPKAAQDFSDVLGSKTIEHFKIPTHVQKKSMIFKDDACFICHLCLIELLNGK